MTATLEQPVGASGPAAVGAAASIPGRPAAGAAAAAPPPPPACGPC